MVTVILGTIGALVFLYIGGNISKAVIKHEKLGKELHERLQILEDRFYHPENYREAFFRPAAKKRDNGKEG